LDRRAEKGGLVTKSSKTWLLIGAAIIAAVAAEMVTVLVWGFPMSWAMADAQPIVVFLVGLFGGGLGSHFWWPAKGRWVLQDRAIEASGRPDSDIPAEFYRKALWEIHTGKPWEETDDGS
jgi:hypothetical protein